MSEMKMPELIQLGHRIRRARELRGWSVRELGRKAGCSASTISRLENATADTWLSIAIRVLRAVDLTLERALADCPSCGGCPPAGFTCNHCGQSASDEPAGPERAA